MVFLLIGVIILRTNGSINLSKLNILTQLIYTVVTTVLVLLTYNVLRETKLQKHQSVRPYINLYNFVFWDDDEKDIEYELDFNMINEGSGLALNLKIDLYNMDNGKMMFSEEVSRLSTSTDNKYSALLDIRNEITKLNKEPNNGSISQAYYISDDYKFEVPLNGERKDFLNLKAIVTYSDIYNKKYRNTFKVRLQDNDDNDDGYDLVESFDEL